MSELASSNLKSRQSRGGVRRKRTQPESAGRILIIDDEAEIRESLETLLQLEGYTVAVAGNGREGMRRFGERTFGRGPARLGAPR